MSWFAYIVSRARQSGALFTPPNASCNAQLVFKRYCLKEKVLISENFCHDFSWPKYLYYDHELGFDIHIIAECNIYTKSNNAYGVDKYDLIC